MLHRYLWFGLDLNNHLNFKKCHSWYLSLMKIPSWYFYLDSIQIFNSRPHHPTKMLTHIPTSTYFIQLELPSHVAHISHVILSVLMPRRIIKKIQKIFKT
jgi:hypothetical protein